MGRIGVTYSEVVKAAESIRSAGKNPTIDRVRDFIGTGSKSTLSNHLRRWRNEDTQKHEACEVPNELSGAVKNIHDKLQQMADSKVEEARDKFQAEKTELEKQLANFKDNISQLTATQNDIKQQLQESSDENQSLITKRDGLRIELAKKEAIQKETENKIAELKTIIADHKQENQTIRDHFDHYQQRIAENRQKERERVDAFIQHLQYQIHDLEDRCAKAESNALESYNILKDQKDVIGQLNVESAELKTKLAQQEADNKDLTCRMKDALKVKDRQINELVENNVHFKEQQSATRAELKAVKQALEKTETALQNATGKNDDLFKKYSVMIQEKAIVQGKLEQWEATRKKRTNLS